MKLHGWSIALMVAILVICVVAALILSVNRSSTKESDEHIAQNTGQVNAELIHGNGDVQHPAERPTIVKALTPSAPAKLNDIPAKQSGNDIQPPVDAQDLLGKGREDLVRELLHASHGRREDILLEIARNRDAFLPLLRSLLKNGNNEEKALAIPLLTKAWDAESLPIFKEMLGTETPSTQAKLIASLRIMEDHGSAPVIREIMDAATEDSVISAAALALGVLGDDSDVNRGLRLVAEQFPPYVQFAGAFLAAMQGDADMREQAISFLSAEDAKAQLYAVTMLPYLGGDDVSRALNRIQTDNGATWPSRTRAALLQMECDRLDTQEEKTARLIAATRDGDDIVAKRAVELLVQSGSLAAREALENVILGSVSSIAWEARFLSMLRFGGDR